MKLIFRRIRSLSLCGLLGVVLGLSACDPQAIQELKEGVSTEADVVQRFGQPERVWPEADGAKTLEYNRQPQGVEDVRRMLGKPAKQVPYKLQNEIVWTWRFLEPPSEKKAFNVIFSPDYRVIRTEIGPDPDGPDMRGGG